MKISIHQGGRILREHYHQDTRYIEAPPAGDYVIRITNDSPARRLAVLSVDGINAMNGADASFDGSGYVLNPWASIDVPGWYRDGKEAAAFSFKEQGSDYASQTGRGTQNVGVIGIAVFDEKVRITVPPIVIEEHHHHHDWPWYGPRPFWKSGLRYTSSRGGGGGGGRGTPPRTSCVYGASLEGASLNCSTTEPSAVQGTMDIGTAYGQAVAFHTINVSFERATAAPVEIITLRYATRERLKSWGVPVDVAAPTRPQAFPASQGCPPPPGWRG